MSDLLNSPFLDFALRAERDVLRERLTSEATREGAGLAASQLANDALAKGLNSILDLMWGSERALDVVKDIRQRERDVAANDRYGPSEAEDET